MDRTSRQQSKKPWSEKFKSSLGRKSKSVVSSSRETLPGTYLKYIPHKADVPPIYLLIKRSHSSGLKRFSRCTYMMFALVYFEVDFHISNPFGFLNIRRR